MTSLTPQAGLEIVAALLAAVGVAVAKPQVLGMGACDVGFPDVLGDVTDADRPEAKSAPGSDPAPVVLAATVPIPVQVQVAAPPPTVSAFGIGQEVQVEAAPESREGRSLTVAARFGVERGTAVSEVVLPAATVPAGFAFAIGQDVPSESVDYRSFTVAARFGVEQATAAGGNLGLRDGLAGDWKPAAVSAKEVTAELANPVGQPDPGVDIATPVSVTELARNAEAVPIARPLLVSKRAPGDTSAAVAAPITIPLPLPADTPAPEASQAPASPAPQVHASESKSEPGKIAFEAKLTPIPQEQPDTGEPQRASAPPKIAAINLEGERKPETKRAEQGGAVTPAMQSATPDANAMLPANPSVEPSRAEAPKAAERAEAPQAAPEPTPEPTRPNTTPVRDIHLELSGGENHVELRLTERAGEVHVAVRTPNSHLAGQLREDLPILTSRLEHAGFRAEAWQPTTSLERTVEAGIRNSRTESGQGDDSSGHHRDKQQQEAREQQKSQTSKQKGNPFAWLMSSLR